MNIFRWFQKEQSPKIISGVNERPGYESDKRNFCSKELLVSTTPISWNEKSLDNFKSYWNGQYTQDGGGSCYAWSLSLLLENANEREEGKRSKKKSDKTRTDEIRTKARRILCGKGGGKGERRDGIQTKAKERK